jgi:hypothetical protein
MRMRPMMTAPPDLSVHERPQTAFTKSARLRYPITGNEC